jgi:methylated-DNA-[protein]-cysteine S-methyltransferase
MVDRKAIMTKPTRMVGFSSKRVVELGYAVQSSPIGDLTVVEGPRGVLLIEFRRQLVEVFGPRIEQALGVPVRVMRRRLETCRELDEYFHGERRHFTVPVDLSLMNGFRREVLEILRGVPFGVVISYGELARRAGRPLAARAVGGAMRSNPIPVVVPCHRVAAADGSLGGFAGGLSIKRKLHDIEGIETRSGVWPAVANA